MKIKWYGTASLLIEGGNTRILIDPYLKKLNKNLPPVPVEEATSAEAIFITHPHFDHLADIADFMRGNVKSVYVSQNGIDVATKFGIPNDVMVPLSAGQTVSVGDIAVRTYEGRHCKFDLGTVLGVAFRPSTYIHLKGLVHGAKMMKKFNMGSESDIFALEICSEGKRVFVLGSAGMDGAAEYPQGADLLVFPYQGRTRMYRYVLPFLDKFRPKAVMLDHFDNAFPPLTHTINTKKFLPAVKERFPEISAFVPLENEWYEV